MLNDARVLNYVKRNLGFPFMHLEWSDEEILEYVKEETIREWSYYIPDVQKMPLNFQLESNKVPGRSNEFYMFEPEGREILNVVDIYFDQGELYALGHPPFGVFTHFELRDFAYRVDQAISTKMFSSWDHTFEFKHPNIVRVSPYPFNELKIVTVEYERMSEADFSEVPNDLQQYFLTLALADIMIALGRIRKRYGGGNLRTPFGEVPLDSDIFDEGKTMKSEVIEKLERLFLPNVSIDHG
ncbi:MAG: hypothetical protein ACTSX1_00610 [Candidatus Heimdallarchaeaceae archaeon]